MKALKIILFIFIFAGMSIFVYLPEASAQTASPVKISMLSKIPGYIAVKDYGIYFTDSHMRIKNVVNSIYKQALGIKADACLNFRIILIGHTVKHYTKYAAFLGYCEYVKLVPKNKNIGGKK